MRTISVLLLSLVLAAAAPAAIKKAIHPKEFPPASFYTPGILVDDTLYVSGQTGSDLDTGAVPETFDAELKLCLDRISLVLKEAGMGFEDVVSVQVYLTDMDELPRMNAVYAKYFKDPKPARATVGVAELAGGAHVEIAVVARK